MSKRRTCKPRPECSVLRCKRRPVALGLCNTHLLQRADAVFSQYIRKRDRHCRVCKGPNAQTMHIISRRYRGLRFDPRNALAGCAKCHTYYTHRELEWIEYIDRLLGDGAWDELRHEALAWDKETFTGAWRELAVECIEKLGA